MGLVGISRKNKIKKSVHLPKMSLLGQFAGRYQHCYAPVTPINPSKIRIQASFRRICMESSAHKDACLPANLHEQADFWQGGLFHLVLSE